MQIVWVFPKDLTIFEIFKTYHAIFRNYACPIQLFALSPGSFAFKINRVVIHQDSQAHHHMPVYYVVYRLILLVTDAFIFWFHFKATLGVYCIHTFHHIATCHHIEVG